MKKINEVEYITVEVDEKKEKYTLYIESYQRNTRLMASVTYEGKNKGISLTLPVSEKDAFETFRILSKTVFNELYADFKKDEAKLLNQKKLS